VATDPSVTSAAQPGSGDQRLWRVALGAGLLSCGAYAATPTEWTVFRDLLLYPLTGFATASAVMFAVRRYRPAAPAAWLLIAAGVASYAIGDTVWTIYELADQEPFPSAADAFYLAGYPLIAAGLLIATRWRTPSVSGHALVDAAMVTTAGGVLVWVYLVEGYRADPELRLVDTVISAAYPLGDLLLLAVAARFLLGASVNVPALRLLVSALVLTLAGDVLFALTELGQLAVDSRISDTLLLLGIVLVGPAGLHPSMRQLTEEAAGDALRGRSRIVVLAVASATPPTVLVVQGVRGEPLHPAATLTGITVMSALVVARFAGLTTKARQAAERDSILSHYTAELLRLHGRDELYAAAQHTADRLAGDGSAVIIDRRASSGDVAFVAPVSVRNEVVAEIVVTDRSPRLSSLRDPLTTVGAQLALALERDDLLEAERDARRVLSEQYEQLRDLQDELGRRNVELDRISRIDILTQLYNRRHLEEQLRRLEADRRRHATPLAVVLMDIDHFKRVNDTYGHGAGDSVLQQCAQRLLDGTRVGDVIGRWGGEEFLMLLPDTSLDEARSISERIRAAVASPPMSVDGGQLIVTISGGCAVDNGGDIDALLSRADAALYRAKAGGRNRIEA
jgi:diguanylate cyclase (GGDEF)-like protein